MKFKMKHLVAVAALATAGIVGVAGSADAAFTSCPTGASGSGGRVCLWTNGGFTGNPSAQYSGTAAGLSVNALSFGNRITNRCAVYYHGTTIVATAGPNTGNTWGSTQNINSIDVSVC